MPTEHAVVEFGSAQQLICLLSDRPKSDLGLTRPQLQLQSMIAMVLDVSIMSA